jgi:anaerobic magnesium-protoporphyrin IX monomethyl ester cyclase
MKIRFVNYQTSNLPPLTYATLSAYVKKYGGYRDVSIIECTLEDALEKIAAEKPDVIGFTLTTLFYPHIIRLAKKLREVPSLKHSLIIIGGPHITALPGSFDPVFDIGVVGEGEKTLLEILNLIKKQGRLSRKELLKIGGIVLFDGKKLIQTQRRDFIMRLDDIPMLDWSIIDRKYFGSNIIFTERPVVSIPIITSRGCPFNCVFCNSRLIWGNVRFHSARRVAEEIEFLVKNRGVGLIEPADDLFTINKQRLRELIEELRQRRLLGRIEFICMARTDTVDEELMQLLKTLNVKRLNFGFESGCDRVLKSLKGGAISMERHRQAVLLCEKYKIKARGSFIFGSPGEKIKDMEETLSFIDFMWKHKVELIWCHVMTPFPNTTIWEIAKQRGKVSDEMDWTKLSLFNTDEPLLLDPGIKLKDFKRVFWKARLRVRLFESRYWFRKLTSSPLVTLRYLFSNLRFVRFFLPRKI